MQNIYSEDPDARWRELEVKAVPPAVVAGGIRPLLPWL